MDLGRKAVYRDEIHVLFQSALGRLTTSIHKNTPFSWMVAVRDTLRPEKRPKIRTGAVRDTSHRIQYRIVTTG